MKLASRATYFALTFLFSLIAQISEAADVLPSGGVLGRDQALLSANCGYKAVFQSDSNFVVYKLKDNSPTWNSQTAGRGGDRLVMQSDGNLVIYQGGTPVWDSKTVGKPGTLLAMQSDGNLMMYQGGTPVWDSKTSAPPLPPTDRLYPGCVFVKNQPLVSQSGRYKAVLQDDGNFAVYDTDQKFNRMIWNSFSAGRGGMRLDMHSDGNLIIWQDNTDSAAAWSSGTNGKTGAVLVMQDDGNLVIYQGSSPVWASGSVAALQDKLLSGSMLGKDQPLVSPKGRFKAVLQGDGNLAVYDTDPNFNRMIWNSFTSAGKGGERLDMHSDGNLIIWQGSTYNAAAWSSGTNGKMGASLVMQDNGNLVIYQGSATVWESKSSAALPDKLLSGSMLGKDQPLVSPNGRYKAVLQGDGNFVVYDGARPTWSSNTVGRGGERLDMHSDGNLILWQGSAFNAAAWSSGTNGKTGAELVMRDDGNLVISQGNTVFWATNTAATPGRSGTLTGYSIGGQALGCNYTETSTNVFTVDCAQTIHIEGLTGTINSATNFDLSTRVTNVAAAFRMTAVSDLINSNLFADVNVADVRMLGADNNNGNAMITLSSPGIRLGPTFSDLDMAIKGMTGISVMDKSVNVLTTVLQSGVVKVDAVLNPAGMPIQTTVQETGTSFKVQTLGLTYVSNPYEVSVSANGQIKLSNADNWADYFVKYKKTGSGIEPSGAIRNLGNPFGVLPITIGDADFTGRLKDVNGKKVLVAMTVNMKQATLFNTLPLSGFFMYDQDTLHVAFNAQFRICGNINSLAFDSANVLQVPKQLFDLVVGFGRNIQYCVENATCNPGYTKTGLQCDKTCPAGSKNTPGICDFGAGTVGSCPAPLAGLKPSCINPDATHSLNWPQ